ncbi:MAG: ribose 5-phosphate isomerase B [Clostridiales bacterium]|nr:ribose 5-phosphate isomerase B [Clostridiales bacterium]
MKIAIGSDNLGHELKEMIIEEFSKQGHEFVNYGANNEEGCDYPDIGLRVANAVANKEVDRGILVCGTGIGMAITANKVKGVYAAVCHDIYSTQRSILSNNANVMCLGAIVIGTATARTLVDTWLGLEFVESPSSKKIQKIKDYEDENY